MILKKALSFDDVLVVPQYSNIQSRRETDLSTSISTVELRIPIISANMSSISGVEMLFKMGQIGGLGILHRFNSINEMRSDLDKIPSDFKYGFSFGIDNLWKDRVEAGFDSGAAIACLDVAHAHHEETLKVVFDYFRKFRNMPLIIGNIATSTAVMQYANLIPKDQRSFVTFKVGIGGGSLCTTRIQTGCGIPTFQSIIDVRESINAIEYENLPHPQISLIADGGIKNSGDIVKAIGAGANAVMLGSLLAGTEECPTSIIKGGDGTLYKVYRGSASYGDKKLRGEEPKNVEGTETLVPYQGLVEKVINHLNDGIRSGLSYSGCKSVAELIGQAQFVEISPAGYQESKPHGIRNL